MAKKKRPEEISIAKINGRWQPVRTSTCVIEKSVDLRINATGDGYDSIHGAKEAAEKLNWAKGMILRNPVKVGTKKCHNGCGRTIVSRFSDDTFCRVCRSECNHEPDQDDPTTCFNCGQRLKPDEQMTPHDVDEAIKDAEDELDTLLLGYRETSEHLSVLVKRRTACRPK